MDDIYGIHVDADLWKLPESSTVETIQATEFWLQHITNKVKVKTRSIEPQDQEAWLNQRKKGSGPTQQSLLGRFVWLVADDSAKTISLSKSIQSTLLERFGLQLAGKYFRTFYSGVAALPRVSNPEFDQRAYAFCYGPKIAATWSHTTFKDSSAGEGITEALIFCRTPPKKEKAENSTPKKNELEGFQNLLKGVSWNAELCRSSAFPAYLFSLMLGRQISMTQAEIVGSIRQVEIYTGFHEYTYREYAHGKDDEKNDGGQQLVEWTAKCSGHAAKLASVTRKGKVLRNLLEFITKTVDDDANFRNRGRPPSGDNDGSLSGDNLLKQSVELLQNRLDMQQVEVEHTLRRTEIQIEAVCLALLFAGIVEYCANQLLQLFQLTSQYDAINTYKLACRTEDISRTSQRDASSMKTLAVVTMFFLPGSFVSSLFSTPTFDWDSVDLTNTGSIGVRLAPQFRLYCAITVPLTLVTFILYFLWLWFEARERKKSEAKSRAENEGLEPKAFKLRRLNGDVEPERMRIAREREMTLRYKAEEGIDFGRGPRGSWASNV